MFDKDKLVEHYRFCLECGKLFEDDYWNAIVNCEDDGELLSGIEAEEHKFCSSIREVTADIIKHFIDTKRKLLYNRGFLDSCLKHYDAYLPICDEIPPSRDDLQNDSIAQKWNNSVEQMDVVMRSNYWSYYERNIPQQVIKN